MHERHSSILCTHHSRVYSNNEKVYWTIPNSSQCVSLFFVAAAELSAIVCDFIKNKKICRVNEFFTDECKKYVWKNSHEFHNLSSKSCIAVCSVFYFSLSISELFFCYPTENLFVNVYEAFFDVGHLNTFIFRLERLNQPNWGYKKNLA